jgi:hypothetical protein
MKHAPMQYANLQHLLRSGGFAHTSNNLLHTSYCRENVLANFSIGLEQVGELYMISFLGDRKGKISVSSNLRP